VQLYLIDPLADSRWDDLVDFEIVPVLTSGEFWANVQSARMERGHEDG